MDVFVLEETINLTLNPLYFQDDQISQERLIYKITGGCTAIVALFFMGKLYVANAGDCR